MRGYKYRVVSMSFNPVISLTINLLFLYIYMVVMLFTDLQW